MKVDTEVDTRNDTRVGTRVDTRVDTGVDTRGDTRVVTRVEIKVDTGDSRDTRVETGGFGHSLNLPCYDLAPPPFSSYLSRLVSCASKSLKFQCLYSFFIFLNKTEKNKYREE